MREAARGRPSMPGGPKRRQTADAVAQAIVANARAMQQIGQAIGVLVQHINAPKEVVYDETGRAVGIRPVR